MKLTLPVRRSSAAAVVPAGAPRRRPAGRRAAPTLGTIRLELYPAKAPKTVENFLQYVKDGHYNGTIFHRVIDGFMIQGGGFDKRLPAEADPRADRERGEARQGRPEERRRHASPWRAPPIPNSATAQFFINVKDNNFLNWGDPRGDGNGYAVFGKVVDGMDVVNKIAKMPTGGGGPFPRDVPKQPVIIESASVVTAK